MRALAATVRPNRHSRRTAVPFLLLVVAGFVGVVAGSDASAASVAPPAPLTMDFETGDWSQFEIAGSGTSTGPIANWPYGTLFDAGRVGAPGGPRVRLVNASSDPAHVRLGNYAARIDVHQGDADYVGLSQGSSIDASWIQYLENELGTWQTSGTYVSNFRPGQSRAALLPSTRTFRAASPTGA